jgi:hypothetical protein
MYLLYTTYKPTKKTSYKLTLRLFDKHRFAGKTNGNFFFELRLLRGHKYRNHKSEPNLNIYHARFSSHSKR